MKYEPIYILDTFCIYCQKDYVKHTQLVTHIKKAHPNTYAYHMYVEAKDDGV